ncbi:unnamed protein product [Closterium sp. Naga37s-1]|nr:unnamed protein product [Closterium sp. Naga37s-1]
MAQSTWSVTASAGSVSQEEQQSGASDQPPLVVATREKGKNGKLMKALSARGVSVMELPLIQHSDGPDTHRLPAVLQEEEFEWIVITSPEAASVFLTGWRVAGAEAGSGGGRHSGGCSNQLGEPEKHLLPVQFRRPNICRLRFRRLKAGNRRVLLGATLCALLISTLSSLSSLSALPASPATAKYLSAEIPEIEGGNRRVLYPASAKASTDLRVGDECGRGHHTGEPPGLLSLLWASPHCCQPLNLPPTTSFSSGFLPASPHAHAPQGMDGGGGVPHAVGQSLLLRRNLSPVFCLPRTSPRSPRAWMEVWRLARSGMELQRA